MRNNRMALVLRVMSYLLVVALMLLFQRTIQPQTSENEQTIWNLEHAYWHHVQDNDLPSYLGLWHKDFLGWPSVSVAPLHKDHITDWITSQTSKGLAFKSVEFKPAAIQMTGDIAVACYWMTYEWLDKDGHGAMRTVRVTHTWLRDGKGWRIIGGMSMQEAAAPQ
jgi:ketosteroid isomerase-like protein